MSWHLTGSIVVVLICAAAFALPCAVAFRALWRHPASFLAAFAALAVGATIQAQKTNGVNNLPPAPLMLMSPPAVSSVSGEDIARGWRVECVTTNAAVSYAMPTNAMLVGNWHVHGAASSFGNNRADFDGWSFPLGTNGAAFSAFWYFVDGRIRPAPRDAAREICAVGAPMSAVPGQSRLWTAEEPDGARVITWDNFFLGGDTNCPVNAQIRLFANGDFTTRSNEVETVCCRVNPDDWDGDGIANDVDLSPLVCDGDFFGPSNILPEGANTNAYCSVSLVATGPDALITFEGDDPSNYPDPYFVAKSGETNEVVILIGKTYVISSGWPFAIVGVSDPETEVWTVRGAAHQTSVCRPVAISASGGNPFTMSVAPANLGGAFAWQPSACCCSLSGSGTTFSWNCPTDCTCCGCAVEGQYSYEGYWLPATSCRCGCHYDGMGPTWEPAPAPLAASVSVTFSKSAVIFEDAYENLPGQWVSRRSTRTRLNIVANGGPNGGTLTVSASNLSKLDKISGPALPSASVLVPAGTKVSYAIVFEGAEESESIDDAGVTAEFVENITSFEQSSHSELTCVRVIIQEEESAPTGACLNRHTYGVGERMRMLTVPAPSGLVWSSAHGIVLPLRFAFPFSADEPPELSLSYRGVVYNPSLTVVEPTGFRSANVGYETLARPVGCPGGIVLAQDFHLVPEFVSFGNLSVEEVPWLQGGSCEGYFSRPSEAAYRYHTEATGAGNWMYVNPINHYVGRDRAGRRAITNDWSAGTLVWDIPIGWKERGSGGEAYGMTSSPFMQQVLRLDANGTVRIEKNGHWVSRALNNDIYKDGELQ